MKPRRDRFTWPRRGTTLIEIMVVMTIVGILTSIVIPCYRRSIEQARVDVAGVNLQMIWTAERLYFLEHRAYCLSLEGLADQGLIDTAIFSNDACYTYELDAQGTAFTATATRIGSGIYSGQLTITSEGTLSGSIENTYHVVLHPGFR